jgi:hypothetical protein
VAKAGLEQPPKDTGNLDLPKAVAQEVALLIDEIDFDKLLRALSLRDRLSIVALLVDRLGSLASPPEALNAIETAKETTTHEDHETRPTRSSGLSG